jgi:ketosteroid isomerase-like protein
MAELVDPDVEQHGTVGGVEEGRVTRGVGEIRRDYEHVEAIWDEHPIEVQELIDAGDRVVVFQREYQRGRRSGIDLVVDAAVLVEVRDGLIVRVQGFMDRAAALEAADLSVQRNVEIVRQGLERFAKTGEPSGRSRTRTPRSSITTSPMRGTPIEAPTGYVTGFRTSVLPGTATRWRLSG